MTTEKICSECGLPLDDIRHLQGLGNIHLRPGIDFEPEADSDESAGASDDEATNASTTTASNDPVTAPGDGSEGADGNPAAEPPQGDSVDTKSSGASPDGVLKCLLCDHTEETPIKLGKHTKGTHDLNLAGARAAAAEKGTS